MAKTKPVLDAATLKMGADIVDKIVGWVEDIEKRMDHYYVDSLEIDLGVTMPFNVGGKLVIKDKIGQSAGAPHP